MYCNGIEMCETPRFSLVVYLLLAPCMIPITQAIFFPSSGGHSGEGGGHHGGGGHGGGGHHDPTQDDPMVGNSTTSPASTTMLPVDDTTMVTGIIQDDTMASTTILPFDDDEEDQDTTRAPVMLPGGYGGPASSGVTRAPSDDEAEIKDWIKAIVNMKAADIDDKIQQILDGNKDLATDIEAMKQNVEILENMPPKRCPSSPDTSAEPVGMYGYRRKRRQAYTSPSRTYTSQPAFFSIYKTKPYKPDKSVVSCSIPFDGSNTHRAVSLELTTGTVKIQQPGVYYLSLTGLKMCGYPLKVQITRNSEVVGSGQHSLGKVTLDSVEGVSTVLAQNNIWSSVYVEALVYLSIGDLVTVKMFSDGALYDDQSRYTHFIGYKLG